MAKSAVKIAINRRIALTRPTSNAPITEHIAYMVRSVDMAMASGENRYSAATQALPFAIDRHSTQALIACVLAGTCNELIISSTAKQLLYGAQLALAAFADKAVKE